MRLEKHKFNIFPEMNGEDYSRLLEDIRANGYDETQPIKTYDSKILDGWNRYKACLELDEDPIIEEFTGDDIEAIKYVMRTNKRRNLNSGQWACIAIESEDIVRTIKEAVERERLEKQRKNAANQHSEPCVQKRTQPSPPERTTKKVADLFNTSKTYISEASRLKQQSPTVYEQVKSGEKTFSEVKKDERKAKVEQQIQELKGKETQPANGKYDVIVIDPPWEMQKIERDVAPNQVGFDYPTMTIDEIANMDLPTAENCHLFMWITQKHLPYGFQILKEWGLKYVCTFVWHKNGGFQPFNLPQYNCEFILYARKGTPSFIDLKNFMLCFNANRTGHSKKPEEFYETVKRVTAGKRIDMFSRRQIDGFETWGNEA